MKDLALTRWGDNSLCVTAITAKGHEFLNHLDVRNRCNRVWVNTFVLGPEQAKWLSEILNSQSDVSVLVEPSENGFHQQ